MNRRPLLVYLGICHVWLYRRTMKTSWTKTLTGRISPVVLTTHKSPIYTFAKVNDQNNVEHPWKPVVSRSEHDVHPQWEAPLLGPWLEVATVLHVDIATLAHAWRKASENNMTPLNGRRVLWDLHGFASYRMYTLHLQHRSSEKYMGGLMCMSQFGQGRGANSLMNIMF